MQRQSSICFTGVDSETPVGEKLSGQFLRTFAYTTIKDRLPIILTKIVDQLARDKEEILQSVENAEDCIKQAIGQLSKLKNELQTNKPFLPIESHASDVELWNTYLLENEPAAWYTTPWLYSENYFYRRIQEIFETSKSLQGYDPFRKQKEEALKSAINQLPAVVNTLLKSSTESNASRFDLAVKLSLWSNRCDLSLSNGVVNSEESAALADIDVLSKFILTDHVKIAFEAASRSSSKTIDIVHDNSAYELFSDLCLAEELLSIGLASTIRLRIKKFPWYVSDVTAPDISYLLDQLPSIGLGDSALRWRSYLSTGVWKIIIDDFWTLPFPYSELKSIDPALYASLAEASLVIFKGDLNYRKLVGDINWPFTTPFKDALQGFQPTTVLSLRTIKADVACDLPDGIAESLSQTDPLWMRTGEYAIIQCSPADKK